MDAATRRRSLLISLVGVAPGACAVNCPILTVHNKTKTGTNKNEKHINNTRERTTGRLGSKPNGRNPQAWQDGANIARAKTVQQRASMVAAMKATTPQYKSVTPKELRVWIIENGFNQATFAMAIKKGKTTVQSWCCGKVPVPSSMRLTLWGLDVLKKLPIVNHDDCCCCGGCLGVESRRK